MRKKKISIGIAAAIVAGGALFTGMTKDDRDFQIVKNLDIFTSVYKELQLFYVDEPDPGKLIPKALDEMLSSLDPYTTYIPEKDKEAYRFQIDGKYGGIGSVVTMSDTNMVQVKEVYDGTPSAKSGLRAGDYFMEIDGKDVTGKTTADVSSMLRGKAGESLTVKMLRPGVAKPLSIKITREEIKVDAVDYYGMLSDGETGYISLRGFETGCANRIREAFLWLRDTKGAKRMILDLRGNPGGLLDESLQIVNLFVPSGSDMLSTKGRRKTVDHTYTAHNEPIDTKMPLVVMINRSSASASEIVSGALQDLDRAVVVGQRSFGKGLVQATREVAYDGYLKVTTAKYYTPSGRCIQALDYSNRDENGAVNLIPDSLISEFHTKNGRVVYDGGGISPDVMLKTKKYGNAVKEVYVGDYPFRYVVSLISSGAPLKTDKDGNMTDEAFKDFISFLKSQKKFSYKTSSQKNLEKVIASAKQENMYDENKQAFDKLTEALSPDLDRDLKESEEDIKRMIEDEYLRSTKYRRSALEHSVKHDPQIEEACKIVNDSERYYGLLNGTVASHAGDKRAIKNNEE